MSYKSDMTPRYNAKDIARYICKTSKAPLVMGSATPDIITMKQAEDKDIQLYTLTKRATNSTLPEVEIVDLRNELATGNRSMLSFKLQSEIENNLKNKKQTILFLNRRGYSTFVMCRECGYVAKCKNCNISLTYHSSGNRLKCHYCGFEMPVIKECPECNSKKVKYFGTGTQKLEDVINKEFPNATQGMFRISIEELKHQFSIPESYTPTDIKRRVLDPAKRNINEIEECDFTFDYELQKVGGKYAGYMFIIKSKKYIETENQNVIVDKSLDAFYDEIKTLLNVFRIVLEEEQIKSIYLLTKQLAKDSMFLTPIFMEFRKILDDRKRTIDDKGAYLYRMIENATKFKSDKSTKSFVNRDISYSDIEADLIEN